MAQFGRPVSDITANWTNTPNWQQIDEASADDGDFIATGNNPSALVSEVALTSTLSDPEVSTGHIVRFRYRKNPDGARNVDLTVALVENTTVRASKALTTLTATAFTDDSFTLTAGEADAITDYTNLRLRFTADNNGGGSPSGVDVSWAELEIPDAPDPQSLPPKHFRSPYGSYQHLITR